MVRRVPREVPCETDSEAALPPLSEALAEWEGERVSGRPLGSEEGAQMLRRKEGVGWQDVGVVGFAEGLGEEEEGEEEELVDEEEEEEGWRAVEGAADPAKGRGEDWDGLRGELSIIDFTMFLTYY